MTKLSKIQIGHGLEISHVGCSSFKPPISPRYPVHHNYTCFALRRVGGDLLAFVSFYFDEDVVELMSCDKGKIRLIKGRADAEKYIIKRYGECN